MQDGLRQPAAPSVRQGRELAATCICGDFGHNVKSAGRWRRLWRHAVGVEGTEDMYSPGKGPSFHSEPFLSPSWVPALPQALGPRFRALPDRPPAWRWSSSTLRSLFPSPLYVQSVEGSSSLPIGATRCTGTLLALGDQPFTPKFGGSLHGGDSAATGPASGRARVCPPPAQPFPPRRLFEHSDPNSWAPGKGRP